MIHFSADVENNPLLAGQPAQAKQYFGDASRYAIAPVHTRFDKVQWFIWDAANCDPITGSVIGQFDYLSAALTMCEELYEQDQEVRKIQASFTLSLRKTHKYNDYYRHLDEEHPVATAITLQSSLLLIDDEDPCEPTRIIKLIEITDHVEGDVPTITQAIKDTMSNRGCSHDYDCCVCWSHSVTDAVPLKQDENSPRHWIVIQHAQRNY